MSQMDPDTAKALAANVNNLLQLQHKQAQTTAKLFKICLEFLDEKRDRHEWDRGFEAAKAAGIKRRERKQQLITAIKGYIEAIENRDRENGK